MKIRQYWRRWISQDIRRLVMIAVLKFHYMACQKWRKSLFNDLKTLIVVSFRSFFLDSLKLFFWSVTSLLGAFSIDFLIQIRSQNKFWIQILLWRFSFQVLLRLYFFSYTISYRHFFPLLPLQYLDLLQVLDRRVPLAQLFIIYFWPSVPFQSQFRESNAFTSWFRKFKTDYGLWILM